MAQTPREIVMSAYKYLADITPPSQKISDVRIEELLTIAEEAGYWKVVLSYDSSSDPFERKREYKEFKVFGEDGNVLNMKSVPPNAK